LNNNSIRFLNNLGFSIPNIQVFPQLKITQHHTLGNITVNAKDYFEKAICYGVDANTLLSHLSEFSSPTYNTVEKISKDESQYILSCKGSQHKAEYLVGCDGQHSTVKTNMRVNTNFRATYHSTLMHGNISGEYLLQYFGPSTITAVIPGKPGLIILSSHKKILPPSINALQKHLKHHCHIENITHTSQYSIKPHIVSTCFQNNCLLLGDAAMSVEPVAAQGLNHAIHNLQRIFNIPRWEQQYLRPCTHDIQQENNKLFSQMQTICHHSLRHFLSRKLLINTHLFSPIIQDMLFQFGNRYE